MSECCLILICPCETEESLCDELLIAAGDAIIVSSPASRHGAHQGQLSNLEQVTGRGRVTQVQLVLDDERIAQLLPRLHTSFNGKGIQYWVIPTHAAGVL